ncbi:hypothetical protein V9T40_001885 [Parthenolecanium corni]|uniref:Sulfhydryl oxidase n=1 Tax=Parthenolecanium corni TaxID=536013 RepID=A0AAN9TFA5_9HEMI
MPLNIKQFYDSNTHSDNDYPGSRRASSTPEEKPCRACSDFKSWSAASNSIFHPLFQDESKKKEVECPLNKSELGNQTWGFLHTMAAYFPDKPSTDDQRDMAQFLRLFSKFYPCPTCARDFTKLIEKEPPRTSSQTELKHWLCWAHNQVNKKLGKPKFDCSKLDERWKYGWKDGSCDV